MPRTLFIIGIILTLAIGGVMWWAAMNDASLPAPSQEVMEEGVIIENDFGAKIVYTTDMSVDRVPLEAHCAAQGGSFNECGSICPPDADFCAAVCAYTCELPE